MRGKNVKWIAGLVLAAGSMVCGVSATHAALLLNDFVSNSSNGGYTSGTQGWFPYGATAMGFQTPTPTGGAGLSWAYMEPGQYYGHFTAQQYAFDNHQLAVANFNANTDLTFDLIFPSSGPNKWFAENSIPLTVDIQFSGGVSGTTDQIDSVNVNTNVQDTIIPVDVPYTPNFDPTATITNLTFEIDPGYNYGWDSSNPNAIPYAAYVYMSNVQLVSVPEPASIALVGGGLSLLSMRRRRRA